MTGSLRNLTIADCKYVFTKIDCCKLGSCAAAIFCCPVAFRDNDDGGYVYNDNTKDNDKDKDEDDNNDDNNDGNEEMDDRQPDKKRFRQG
jgi:hypothetical protein